MGEEKKGTVYVQHVDTQNFYESGAAEGRPRMCVAEASFAGGVKLLASDDVSAMPVLGGGVLLSCRGGLSYFPELDLVWDDDAEGGLGEAAARLAARSYKKDGR